MAGGHGSAQFVISSTLPNSMSGPSGREDLRGEFKEPDSVGLTAFDIFIQGTIEVDTVNTLFSGVRCVRSRKFWELDLDDFVTDGVPDQIGDRVIIETPHEGSTMHLCRLNAHPESNSNVPIRLAFGQ